MYKEDILDRVRDRYTVEELIEVLEVTMDDMLENFEDVIFNNLDRLDIDVEEDDEDDN